VTWWWSGPGGGDVIFKTCFVFLCPVFKELKESATELLFGGHETTASAATSLIAFLGLHHDVLQKVRKELQVKVCVSPEPFHRSGQGEGTSRRGVPDRALLHPGGALLLGGGREMLLAEGQLLCLAGALAACSIKVMAASSFLGVTVQSQPREAAGHGGLGAAEVHELCHQRDPQAEPSCSWRISNCTQDS